MRPLRRVDSIAGAGERVQSPLLSTDLHDPRSNTHSIMVSEKTLRSLLTDSGDTGAQAEPEAKPVVKKAVKPNGSAPAGQMAFSDMQDQLDD